MSTIVILIFSLITLSSVNYPPQTVSPSISNAFEFNDISLRNGAENSHSDRDNIRDTSIGFNSSAMRFSNSPYQLDDENVNIAKNDAIKDYYLTSVKKEQDIDQNNIADSFQKKLIQAHPSQIIDGILSLSQPQTTSIKDLLENMGVEIIREYEVIHGFHVRANLSVLLGISKLEIVDFLEENTESQTLLYDGTMQLGARFIWDPLNGYGYTGDPNTAIAILDTGVDDSHTDASFDIAYWKDFIGASGSISGDEYPNPTDKGEHGTHVASIAASSGAQLSNDRNNIQDSGSYPIVADDAYYGTWFYLPSTQTITLQYSWEGGGTPFAGIYDGTNWIWNNYNSPDTSSPATYNIGLNPGWYAPMWGNKNGAGGNFYSAQVSYNSGSQVSSDGFGTFTGVAPDSKIVGLKVLDDTGSGTLTALMAALDWIYTNGQIYNITVVNLSLGFSSVIVSVDTAITNLVRNKGIVCVAAAGNDGTSSGGIYSPSSSPDCISVGAVNKADEIAYYSSVGSPSQNYLRPDVVAPGGSLAWDGSSAIHQPIFGSDSNDADEALNDPPLTDYYSNNYRGYQGTSMASPFVAGLVQLVIDAMIEQGTWTYSWDTAKKIKQIILMSTFEVKNVAGGISSGGETYDGDGDGISQNPPLDRMRKDYTEGWGRVSAVAALQAVTKWLQEGITTSLSLDGNYHGNHVEVRQITLEEDIDYQMIGNLGGTPVIDADLLLFAPDPDQYGDPVLVAFSTKATGNLEAKTFKVPTNGTYYLVVRWVGGGYEGTVDISIKKFISLTSIENGMVISSGTSIEVDIIETYLDSVLYNWDDSNNQSWSSPYQTLLPIGDGNHVLSIYAMDQDGTWVNVTYGFTTDDTFPLINLTFITNNSYYKSGSQIDISISDLHLEIVMYNWDGNTNQSWQEPYQTSLLLGEGKHFLNIYANDTVGHYSSKVFAFITDNTAPNYSQLSQSTVSPEYYGTNTIAINVTEPVDASGVDTILLYYRVDGGPWDIIDITSTSNYTFLPETLFYNQFYEWYIRFNDTAGNVDQTSIQSFMVVDTTPPQIDNPSDVTYEEGSIGNSIVWIVGDINPGIYNVTLDGNLYISDTIWINGEIHVSFDGLSVGKHTLIIYAYDSEGNVEQDDVIITVIDTTPPDVDSPPDVTYEEGSIGNSIVWTVGDINPGIYNATLDGNSFVSNTPWVNGTIVVIIDGFIPGLYIFILTANDKSGNLASDTVNIRVEQYTTENPSQISTLRSTSTKGTTHSSLTTTKTTNTNDYTTSTSENEDVYVFIFQIAVIAIFFGYLIRKKKNKI